MFGSDSLDRFGLPTMPAGWDQPPPQSLQWPGVDSNPFFGGPGGNASMAPPAAPGMAGQRGSANPSVPALMSANPLAQGATGSVLGRPSAPDVAPPGAAISSNPPGGPLTTPTGSLGGPGVQGPPTRSSLGVGALGV